MTRNLIAIKGLVRNRTFRALAMTTPTAATTISARSARSLFSSKGQCLTSSPQYLTAIQIMQPCNVTTLVNSGKT